MTQVLTNTHVRGYANMVPAAGTSMPSTTVGGLICPALNNSSLRQEAMAVLVLFHLQLLNKIVHPSLNFQLRYYCLSSLEQVKT